MIKRIAQAWGFAAILLLPDYIDLTSTLAMSACAFPGRSRASVLAQLVDLAIVASRFRRPDGNPAQASKSGRESAGSLLRCCRSICSCCNLRMFSVSTFPTPRLPSSRVAWIALARASHLPRAEYRRETHALGSAVLTGVAVFAFVMTCSTGARRLLASRHRRHFRRPIPAQSAGKPRLIWILFDELAYKPYSKRATLHSIFPISIACAAKHGVHRHDADRLPDQRGGAQPDARATSSPDLLYTANNRYLVRTTDDPALAAFDVDASLFGLAKQHGVTTSIVGWYIAYCPIFAGTATECYWSNDDAQDRGTHFTQRQLC